MYLFIRLKFSVIVEFVMCSSSCNGVSCSRIWNVMDLERAYNFFVVFCKLHALLKVINALEGVPIH